MVYVVIDEPNVSAQDNSLLVLELAKSIMEEAFPYLGITTIQESEQIKAADAAAAAQAEGKDFGDTGTLISMKIIQIHMIKRQTLLQMKLVQLESRQLGNCEQRRLMYNSEKDGISYKEISSIVIFYEK